MQRWRRNTCLLRINNANGLTLDIALEQKSVTLLFLGVMLAERGKRLAVALGHKLSLFICTRCMWREVHATTRVERVLRQARCVCMGRCWNEGNKQQDFARGLTRRSECCFGEVSFLDINTY